MMTTEGTMAQETTRDSGNGGQRLVGVAPDPFTSASAPAAGGASVPAAPPLPVASAPRVAPRMRFGYTAEVPPELLKRLVLKHIAEVRGIDLLELLDGAEVNFLDAADDDVPLDRAAVTWG